MFLTAANANRINFLNASHADIPPKNSILTVAGFMSGTSLDGVDVALLKTDGHTIVDIGPSLTLPYEPSFQQMLQKLLNTCTLCKEVIEATHLLMEYHVRALWMLLKDHPSLTPDLLSVHGQTLFHQGRRWNLDRMSYDPASTWQVCLPDMLYKAFQCPVIFDHRTKDIDQGGEGAPLVPIFHWALAQSLKEVYTLPLAFLNIGGVSNITVIQEGKEEAMWAGDVGPGNALINDYAQRHFSKPYDEGGKLATHGHIHQHLVEKWMTHDYFHAPFPKSLDRNTFSFVLKDIHDLSPLDGLATLTSLTVRSIVHSLPKNLTTLLLCGGGRHNHAIINPLHAALSCPVMPCDNVTLTLPSNKAVPLNGDSMEAYAFAYLGARTYYNLPTSFPKTTGVPFPVVGGSIFTT